MVKRVLVVVAVVWSLSVLPAVCQERFSLSDAVEYAKENSPVLRSADFRVDGADMDIKSARGGFLPTLSSGLSRKELFSERSKGATESDYLDQTYDSANITLTQSLYAGGTTTAYYRHAREGKKMFEAKREMAELTLVHEVEMAFFQLMKAKEDVSAALDTVARLESSLKSAEAYLERQMAPLVAVLEAKVNLSSAQQELIRARNAVKKGRANLLAIMNMPMSPSVVFDGGLDYYPAMGAIDADQAVAHTLEHRPDILALEKEKEMARRNADSAKGAYLPEVDLSAGYYFAERDYNKSEYDANDQENQYWMAGITVSWVMFDGGTSWYRRKKYLGEMNRIDADILALKNTLKSNVKQAILQLEDASERIDTAREAVAAATENYEMEEKRLETGISTTPMLLDAQSRLTNSRGDYNNALFDYQLAASDLRFFMGGTLPGN